MSTASKGFVVQRKSVALARGQGRRVDRMIWEVFDAGGVVLDPPPEVFCPDFAYGEHVPANAERICVYCDHALCDGVCELGDDDETADYHLLEIPDLRGVM